MSVSWVSVFGRCLGAVSWSVLWVSVLSQCLDSVSWINVLGQCLEFCVLLVVSSVCVVSPSDLFSSCSNAVFY